MDFTCGTCDWAPIAGSSITAKTNLPFQKGAPIEALKQDIDILDSAGKRVGRLSTGFARANYTGSYVSTTITDEPLTIYPDAHETYIKFIDDLNMNEKYTLGLSGTADSILNLGVLGNITVTGIKLNVKSTLDGLRGLADLKYLNVVTLLPTGDRLGAIVLVAINNPSKLTLKIGDLTLSAGLNYTREGYGADCTLADLTLVPGRNEVIATTIVNQATPVGRKLVNDLGGLNPPPLYLMPLPGASKNPALDAGLVRLRQVLVLPPQLLGNFSAMPYVKDWNLDIPASAANDGIFYASTTVSNPFYGLDFNVVSVNGAPYDPSGTYNPSRLELVAPLSVIRDDIFYLIPPNSYSLKGGESKEMKFAVQFRPQIGNLELTDMQFWFDKATNSTTIDFNAYLIFYVQIGNDPAKSIQDLSSSWIYFDKITGEAPYMKMHAGPSFAYLMKYFENFQRNSTTVVPPTSVAPIATPSGSHTMTVSVPLVTPTSGTTGPVVPPSAVPTTAGPSPVGPSPVAPSPVAPSPIAPSPVAPTP
ncbi:hypothetical protein BGZ82_000608 [Podila clonocystis]|nr:hypothetical protein BGZ82_000608 [Podila clonocystis]